MKRILCFLFTLFLFPMLVYGREYEVSELSLKIDIPDSFDVLTVENYKGNPLLEKYQMTEKDLESIFALNDAYINAYRIEDDIEIFVGNKDSIGDFRNKNNSQLEELKEEYISSVKNHNFQLADISIQKINGIPFIVAEYDAKIAIVIDYVTVLKSKAYTFKFQTSKSFTDENRKEFRSIMDSVSIEVEKVTYENISLYVMGAIIFLVGVIFLVKKKKDKSKCPYCKFKIEKDNTFCPRCGNQLKKDIKNM